MSNYDVKQAIVMRKDLGMRKGKMIAQGAHASMAVLLNRGGFAGYNNERFEFDMTKAMEAWLSGSFAKICLSCNSEEELLALHKQAEDAGIPCSLITDAGYTEFNGVPTNTCIAIGPAHKDDIDKITGDLKLL